METLSLFLPEQIEVSDDAPPPVRGTVPGILSSAEMIALWEKMGVFDVWEDRKAEIGIGKRFADNLEYARDLRERASYGCTNDFIYSARSGHRHLYRSGT